MTLREAGRGVLAGTKARIAAADKGWVAVEFETGEVWHILPQGLDLLFAPMYPDSTDEAPKEPKPL